MPRVFQEGSLAPLLKHFDRLLSMRAEEKVSGVVRVKRASLTSLRLRSYRAEEEQRIYASKEHCPEVTICRKLYFRGLAGQRKAAIRGGGSSSVPRKNAFPGVRGGRGRSGLISGVFCIHCLLTPLQNNLAGAFPLTFLPAKGKSAF